ncbi:efflux RND transporter periplasmic adaptor subunit [Desulfonema magnum]|uniref:RND efflux transporter domain-containing protein n=1 Tax=Desulfonema magnum TaxID=45655 RepID=A0A975BP10_9BACT|nr:HlyD family efflux transporter periplasmic adaptor subunit [Desulfonema magnum]QTA89018.1 RND efflux transporter domain-containing protein [Desulfonema magnum]
MKPILFFMIFLFLCPCPGFAQDKLIIQRAKKNILLTGYTRSKTTVTVSSEVSGKVLRVNYDVGQTIGKKPFFETDPTFIDFQIKSTRQSIKKLKIAQQKIASRVSYLEKEFIRIDKLHKGDRATEVKRDAAEEELKQAKFESQTLAVEKAVLQTTLKELRERKNRHNISAPEGWIVVEKIVEAGEIIGPNMPLAKVSNYRTLVVPLSVSGKELAALKELPQAFEARLEGKPVTAAIHWVNPEFNEKTRKLSIQLVLTHYEGETRGGLRFSLPLETETEGFLVPKAAVISRYDNPRITIKGTGKPFNIMVLGETEDYVIIAEDEQLSLGTELTANE